MLQACREVVSFFSVTKMDRSDEEDFALLLLADERNEDDRTQDDDRTQRHHFHLRLELGEIKTTFQSLMDHFDEALFFNYGRMSYKTYKDLNNTYLCKG